MTREEHTRSIYMIPTDTYMNVKTVEVLVPVSDATLYDLDWLLTWATDEPDVSTA